MHEQRLRAALSAIVVAAAEAADQTEDRRNKQDKAFAQGLQAAANIAARALAETEPVPISAAAA